MRKFVLAFTVLAVAMSSLAAPAAVAKKPVQTTLYLHGNAPIGDGAEGLVNIAESLNMTLDTTKPTDAVPKSYGFTNPVGNDECSGNSTFFPTWVGNLNGTIVGDAKWTAHFVAPNASQVIARIWVDTPISSCNESYIPPAQELIVDVPAGHNEVDIVFKKLKLKAQGTIMLELLQRTAGKQGRVLYDAADYASSITFKCIPASGKNCA